MSEKSAWEKYKEKHSMLQTTSEPILLTNQEASPAIIEQPEWVDPKIYSERLLKCIDCPEFMQDSKICKECGCFMIIKTKIPHAACPLGKW